MEEDGAQKRRVLLDQNSMEVFNLRMKNESKDVSIIDDLTKFASYTIPDQSILNNQDDQSKINSQLDQTFNRYSQNNIPSQEKCDDKIQHKTVSMFQQPQQQYNFVKSSPQKKIKSQGQSLESLPIINGDIPSTNTKNDFFKNLTSRQQESTPQTQLLKQHGNNINQEKKQSIQIFDKFQIDINNEIIKTKRRTKKTNQFSLFNRTNMVKRFITTLLSKTQSYLFKHLSRQQMKIIDDKSSNYDYYLNRQMIQAQELSLSRRLKFTFLGNQKILVLYIILSILKNEKLIIMPESFVSIIWEILSLIISIYIIFAIPYFVNFKEHEGNFIDMNINGLTLLTLVVDIFIKLNKKLYARNLYQFYFQQAIYKRGMIIIERKKIFKEYLKKESMYEIILFGLMRIQIIFVDLDYLEYIIILRVISVIKTLKGLFEKYDQECKYTILVKITVLVIVILSFGNIQGSIFVKIALHSQSTQQRNWLNQIPVNSTNRDIYIAGMYWSTITMATIGYGDIHPTNSDEMIYASVVSLISCGIFGYSISQIGEIVAAIQERKENFNKKMLILNKEMNQRKLNKKLQHQVRNYFEYLHKEESLDEDDASTMINNLPSSMRQSITFDMNHQLLYEQKIFSLNFSSMFLDKLSLHMKQIKIGPEIQLFKQNEVDQRIYFILKGSVDVHITLNNTIKSCKILRVIQIQSKLSLQFIYFKKGDLIGETEFFSQSYRRFSARTLNVVKLMVIDFSDFYKCIKNFQSDFEKYNEIKDKVGLLKDMTNLDRRCQSCGKFTHQFTNCPNLVFVANKNKIIHQQNYQVALIQDRQTQNRNIKKTYNAMGNQRKTQIVVQIYQKMNKIIPINPNEEQLYDSDASQLEGTDIRTDGIAITQLEELSDSTFKEQRKKAFTQMEILDPRRFPERHGGKKSTFHKENQDLRNNFEKTVSIDERLNECSPKRGKIKTSFANEYQEANTNYLKNQSQQIHTPLSSQLVQMAQISTQLPSLTAIQPLSSKNVPHQQLQGNINIDIASQIAKQGILFNNYANSLPYISQNDLNNKIGINEFGGIETLQNISKYDKQQTGISNRSHFQIFHPNGFMMPNENSIFKQNLEQFYIIPNFETMRIFKQYFPHNNYNRVLKTLKSIQTRQDSNGRVLQRKSKKKKNIQSDKKMLKKASTNLFRVSKLDNI